MAYKQLGPGVSHSPQTVVPAGGAYTAEDHSWESVVFQYNQPVMDWELNLHGEICGPYGLGQHVRRTMPSGFLSGDFYETGGGNDPGVAPSDFAFPPPVPGSENQFAIAAGDLVVNGWPIRFEYSDTDTNRNIIMLPVPPVAGTRTDAVILEVWRALVSPGTADNKSASGQVFRFGNLKAPDAAGNQNLADDLVDPAYARPTQARVQIQYRYRVIPGWDLATYPELPDGAESNRAPLAGDPVDGVGSGLNYARVDGDSGLWRAGVGDAASAAALNTVDGFMYAVPVCAVFRRNSAAFDMSLNLNGGAVVAAGTSDRPDGCFSDSIHPGDVLDLRKAVATDAREALVRNFNHLMRDELVTSYELTADGCAGTAVLRRDSLVAGSSRAPDGVRFTFSDKAATETIMTPVELLDGGGVAHTQVVVDLAALATQWGVVNLPALAPVGTKIVGIKRIWVEIPSIPIIMNPWLVNPFCSAMSATLTDTTVTLDILDGTVGAPMTFYFELEIAYPSGSGAFSRIPLQTYALWVPLAVAAWADPATISNALDPNYKVCSAWTAAKARRELQVTIPGTAATQLFRSPDGNVVWIPLPLDGNAITVDDGVNPAYATTNYVTGAATVVTLDFAVAPNSQVSVTYVPVRPLPDVPGIASEVFYQARATQSVPVPAGVNFMTLRMRSAPSAMTVVTSGTASPDDMLPMWLTTGYFQIPIGTADSESTMCSSVTPQLSLSASGPLGHVSLPVLYDSMPQGQVMLQNNADTTADIDGRNFWPRVSVPVTLAAAPQLASDSIHKTVYPALMEVVSTDTDSIRPGTLVLALFTQTASVFQPGVFVDTVPGSGCVALYRTRGNLMNSRRTTP